MMQGTINRTVGKKTRKNTQLKLYKIIAVSVLLHNRKL